MHNENKINIPDKDGFLSFLEALEFFNNTFFRKRQNKPSMQG